MPVSQTQLVAVDSKERRMAWKQFFEDFHDHLAPKLDAYEQMIYLYAIRHSRLMDRDEAVIGFRSARRRMAMGLGQGGRSMSESTAREKLQSLVSKGLVTIITSAQEGTRLRVHLPSEIPGAIPPMASACAPRSLDDVDFFEEQQMRPAILARENGRCFYCLRKLAKDDWVIEHVRSRPEGSNGFRNVVAACRACNNRKGSMAARDFVRSLYREALLNADELQQRILPPRWGEPFGRISSSRRTASTGSRRRSSRGCPTHPIAAPGREPSARCRSRDCHGARRGRRAAAQVGFRCAR